MVKCVMDWMTNGKRNENVLILRRIVRKLKEVGAKAGAKHDRPTGKTLPLPVDEIGYEASSLLAQTEHEKKRRKS